MTLQGSSGSQGTAGTGSHGDLAWEPHHGERFDRLGVHPVWQKRVVICTGDPAYMARAPLHAAMDVGARAHTGAGTSCIKLARSGSYAVGVERATAPCTPLNLTQTLIQCIPQERCHSDTYSLCMGCWQDSLDPADTQQ